MRTTLHLQIPKPCHEDWTQMTPQQRGRFCRACQKTVIDFTKATDEQIVKAFQTEQQLCGRFKETQLNRELVLARKANNKVLSFAASTFFAFLSIGTQEVEAQGKPKILKVDSSKAVKTAPESLITQHKQKRIIGVVKMAYDSLPLPGATISIKGTDKKVQADFDGIFHIEAAIGDILTINYIGCAQETVSISEQSKVEVYMREDPSQFEEVIMMGYYVVPHKNRRLRRIRREQIKNGELQRTKVGQFLFNISSIFRRKE